MTITGTRSMLDALGMGPPVRSEKYELEAGEASAAFNDFHGGEVVDLQQATKALVAAAVQRRVDAVLTKRLGEAKSVDEVIAAGIEAGMTDAQIISSAQNRHERRMIGRKLARRKR